MRENTNDISNNLMPYIKVTNIELKKLSVFGNDYDTISDTGSGGYSVLELVKAFKKYNKVDTSYKIF